MSAINFQEIVEGITRGNVVPYLDPGVLAGVKSVADDSGIPADSDSLILAMTEGKPLSPRLMYEFPRAAMHYENKRGRKFIENFLHQTYAEKNWQHSNFHHWLAEIEAPLVIDTNRDTQMQEFYTSRAHTLVVGVARIAAHPYRFDIYTYKNGQYESCELEDVDTSLPVLFKPLGSPLPKASFIASDADFVDYITELMGGFAIPSWLKEYRVDKQYVFLGMRFTRDTERMIMSDMVYAAAENTGWAFIPEPTEKERRFLEKRNIAIVEEDWTTLL